MERQDGEEYLFDIYTLVDLPDGTLDEKLAQAACRAYSREDGLSAMAATALNELEALGLDEALKMASREAAP